MRAAAPILPKNRPRADAAPDRLLPPQCARAPPDEAWLFRDFAPVRAGARRRRRKSRQRARPTPPPTPPRGGRTRGRSRGRARDAPRTPSEAPPKPLRCRSASRGGGFGVGVAGMRPSYSRSFFTKKLLGNLMGYFSACTRRTSAQNLM